MSITPSQQPISQAIDLEPSVPPRDLANNHHASEPLPHSRATILKLASAGLSFFCAGMNDGSLGALVPYILRHYDINTDLVSIV